MREKKLPTAIGQQILDVILKPHKHKHRKGRAKQHPATDKSESAHSPDCGDDCGKKPVLVDNGTDNAEKSPEKGDDD